MWRSTPIFVLFLAAVVISALASHSANAGQYQLTASRKASNMYKVDGQPFWFETRMCLELALRTSITLDTSRGGVTFYQSYGAPTACALVGVYQEQSFQGKGLDAYGNVVLVESLLVPARL